MLALSPGWQTAADAGYVVATISGAALGLSAAGRLRPVRWVYRTLIGEPAGRFFRDEVTAIVRPLHDANIEALKIHTDEEMLIVAAAAAEFGRVASTAEEALEVSKATGDKIGEVLELAIVARDSAEANEHRLAALEAGRE